MLGKLYHKASNPLLLQKENFQSNKLINDRYKLSLTILQKILVCNRQLQILITVPVTEVTVLINLLLINILQQVKIDSSER